MIEASGGAFYVGARNDTSVTGAILKAKSESMALQGKIYRPVLNSSRNAPWAML